MKFGKLTQKRDSNYTRPEVSLLFYEMFSDFENMLLDKFEKVSVNQEFDNFRYLNSVCDSALGNWKSDVL